MKNIVKSIVPVVCVLAIAFASTVLAADTELGDWKKLVNKNGSTKKPEPEQQGTKVFKTDKGRYYLKFPDSLGDGKLFPSAGTELYYDGKSVTQPEEEKGPYGDFHDAMRSWIDAELDVLTPTAFQEGQKFYSLKLPQNLREMGDAAEIWGDPPVDLTDSAYGFRQEGSLMSVFASSTEDGSEAVRYDYVPDEVPYEFEFLSKDEVTFGSGEAYTLNESIDFEVTGVPEPATLSGLLIGAVALISRRR